MIGTILAITLPAFAVGTTLLVLANRAVATDERRRRWLKLSTYFVIVHGVLLSTVAGRIWALALAVGLIAAGAWEIDRALSGARLLRPADRWLMITIYVAVGLLAIYGLLRLSNAAIAFLYLVVAAFDGFSEVSGRLFGRLKLAPTISPGKTVEGLAGGAMAALATAIISRDFIDASPEFVAVFAVVIAASALAGDLAASWMKRRAGIKDFGGLIPGHGGVLDRFDSYIGACALAGVPLSFVLI
jgi:phosphatidate cytidylyltransferase